MCSDALFLDLALEGAARRAVEAALPALRTAATEGGEGAGRGGDGRLGRLLGVAAAAAESAALSAGGDAELALCAKGVQVHFPSRKKDLRTQT